MLPGYGTDRARPHGPCEDAMARMTAQLSDEPDPTALPVGRPRLRLAQSLLILVLMGLILYLPGIRWGLPATVSWSQDTIAGMRTLGATELWPGDWKGWYPPLHYLLLRAAYAPVLAGWHKTGALVERDNGSFVLASPQAPKMSVLFLIARLISVAMGILAGVGVLLAARHVSRHESVALVGALLLMCAPAFVYFAHLGNVDVPAACWIAFSALLYVRLVDSRSAWDAAFLGVFAGLAVATKDASAGLYPGMAVVLVAMELHRFRENRPLWKAAVGTISRPRWFVGAAAFAAVILLANGAFANPGPMLARLAFWTGANPETMAGRHYVYPNQLALLGATLRAAAGGWGWCLVAAAVVMVFGAIRAHRRIALITLVPVLGYYLVIIAPLGFVYSRYLFPPMVLICVLGAAVLARAGPWVRRFPATAALLLSVVAAPTLGYALAIDLEMRQDTRFTAERWFAATVPAGATVGAFSKPQYLPRLNEMGYPTFAVEMRRESFERPQPQYLILTSYNYDDFDEPQRACLADLVDGMLGYEPVAAFRARWLGTGRSWLAIAGWGAPTPGKISPTITVLRRSGP